MTNKEKDYINKLGLEVVKLKHDRLNDYTQLDNQITKLYILLIVQAVVILLLSFK